jgi:hypothetical protein
MKLRIGHLAVMRLFHLLPARSSALWQWPSPCCRTCAHGMIAQSHHDHAWFGPSIWTSEYHLMISTWQKQRNMRPCFHCWQTSIRYVCNLYMIGTNVREGPGNIICREYILGCTCHGIARVETVQQLGKAGKTQHKHAETLCFSTTQSEQTVVLDVQKQKWLKA